MKNIFLTPDNKMLYKKAKTVKKIEFKEDWFLSILNQMKEAAGENQHGDKKKPIMVGLAAPQIGHSYRIIFVDTFATGSRGKYGNNIFMINPKIILSSKKIIKGREGCYSTKLSECDIRGMVGRSDKVKVVYFDESGVKKEEEFSGFTSVIIQHEIDHLEGKVFVHKIKRKEDLHIVFPSENIKYKKTFKNWKRNIDPKIYFNDICKM